MTEQKATPATDQVQPGLSKIKNIIAIASGKGGVGKSTVSTNLAIALSHAGAKVGLMDADIYGPSQPGMLGSKKDRPGFEDNLLYPVSRHGISFISMGLLLAEDSPVIWRAPIAMKMIHQFIGGMVWGELDYLLIDLPPGTGDVQLTLAQQASLTGAIIVTTPQRVALGVARKGLKMFKQVNVPILGIIENMSGFTCGHCGKETAIFKDGGGKRMASEMKVPYLGALPLDPEIMMSGDDGVPVLTRSTDSPSAKSFLNLAAAVEKVIGEIAGRSYEAEPKGYKLSDDGKLLVEWPDGHQGVHSAYHLRLACGCASCIDEDSGKPALDPATVPLDIKIESYNPVGRYGLGVSFSDGHNTGIYLFNRLRQLCECDECVKGSGDREDSFAV